MRASFYVTFPKGTVQAAATKLRKAVEADTIPIKCDDIDDLKLRLSLYSRYDFHYGVVSELGANKPFWLGATQLGPT